MVNSFKWGNAWLGMALMAGAVTVGCDSSSASAVTQDATTLVAQAVESTTDSTDAVEVSSLMRGLHLLRPTAVEGFHCDPDPVITNTTVCGKSLPATVQLEWTSCAPPAPPARPGKGGASVEPSVSATADGKGSGGKGGGSAPPPPPDGGKTPPEGKGPRFGPSSGKVDIAYTYAAPADCSGPVTQNQAVTFDTSRTDEDGAVSRSQGHTTSGALLIEGAPPRNKASSVDVTRTLTDAAGTVVRSVHLTGAQSVEFSSDTPPVRTLNGSFSETHLDGSTGSVTLTNIVRPPRDSCPWPTGGSLTRTSGDTSHTLVFSAECGMATLDGTEVDLSAGRRPDPDHDHGPGPGKH